MGFLTGGLGGMVLILSALLWWSNDQRDDLQRDLDLVNASYQTMQDGYINAVNTRDQCVRVNHDNAAELERAQAMAQAAMIRFDILKQATEAHVEGLDAELAELRARDDGTCRTMSDDLPAEYVRRVYHHAAPGGDL